MTNWTLTAYTDDDQLVDDIRKMADAEHRSISNLITKVLKDAVEAWKGEHDG